MIKAQFVKIKKTLLSGEIIHKRFSESFDEMEYLVQYVDDGEIHQRWFLEDQIEAA